MLSKEERQRRDAIKKKRGKILKMRRQLRNFTQKELSITTGLPVAFISRLEQGRTYASFDDEIKLIEALDIDLADLHRDHILPEGLSDKDPKILDCHRNASGAASNVAEGHEQMKYIERLCHFLSEEELYDSVIIAGEEGLKRSHEHYLTIYPNDDEPNGYFDDPGSIFSWENFLVRDVGKAIEKIHVNEKAIIFYENYLSYGHWIYGLTYAVERLSIIYNKLKMPEKSKSILDYALEYINLPEREKMEFQERLDRINKKPVHLISSIKINQINKVAKRISPYKFPLNLSRQDYQPPELDACTHLLDSYSIVFKTENTFWWSIQSLLYYEEIFARIPRQTFPGYKELNGCPIDFFRGEKFYERRKKLFKKKNKYLCGSDLSQLISDRYKKHKHENIRHLILEDISLDGLLKMVKVIPSDIVVGVCDRINSNVMAFRTGLPDLFVSNDDGHFKFVEVKKKRENIRVHQKQWLEFLHNNGVDVQVYRIGNSQ